MHSIYDIIKRPLVTEKATALKAEANKVAFEVAKKANKIEIRGAVEKLFNVEVLDVNTLIVRGKYRRVGQHAGRRSTWKKAVVTLKEGTDLDVFGTMSAAEAPTEG